MKTAMVALTAAMAGLSAWAGFDEEYTPEKGYVLFQTAKGDSNFAWTNGTWWSDGLAPHDGTNYYVGVGKVLKSLSTADDSALFGGTNLVVAGQLIDRATSGNKMNVHNLTMLAGSKLHYHSVGAITAVDGGVIDIRGTEASPVIINYERNDTRSLAITAKFVSDGAGYVRFYMHGTNSISIGKLKLTNSDLSRFLGTFEFRDGALETSASLSMPGTLMLKNTETYTQPAALELTSAGKVFTCGTLKANDGSLIACTHSKGSVSRVVVNDDAEFTGVTTIKISGTLLSDKEFHRLTVLTVPASVDLSVANFALDAVNGGGMRTSYLTVQEDAGGQTKSLVYVYGYYLEPSAYGDKVYLLDTDPGAKDNKPTTQYPKYAEHAFSSLTNGLNWSDGEAPHAGKDYLVQGALSTVWYLRGLQSEWSDGSGNTGADYVFPGDSLTLKNNGTYVQVGEKVRFDRLVTEGEAGYNFAYAADEMTLTGSVEIASGNLYVRRHAGGDADLWTTFSGPGRLVFQGYNGTGSPRGIYNLRCDNPDFTGRILVTHAFDDVATQPDYRDITKATNLIVNVYRELCLGGKRPTFDQEALTLTRGGTVLFASSGITVTTNYNRGVTVDGHGRFRVGVNKRVNLDTPIAYKGTLRLQCVDNNPGVGVFRFSRAAVPGENAALDVVRVDLAVADADAVNGLAVALDDTSRLRLEVDPADAARMRWGIRLDKAGSSLTLPAAVEQIPLLLDLPARLPRESLRIGLITVAAADADKIRGKLPDFSEAVRGFSVAPVEVTDAATGAVTFALDCAPLGLLMLVR